MTFWCLFGQSKAIEDLDTPIHYLSSDELISLLEEHRDDENKQDVDELSVKIRQLKEGIEVSNQKLITEFLE